MSIALAHGTVRYGRYLQDAEAASPIVKWAGGKTKLLPELLARVPERFGCYYEPFAGGAALFFALQPKRAVLGDANPDLMLTYLTVRLDVDAVIEELRYHAEQHCKAHYYGVRDAWNERSFDSNPAARAAAFLYMNRVCFNGLWRVNSNGGFNVPAGAYKNPTICNEALLRSAARAFAGASMRAVDYRTCVQDATAGDFVYFDPPYDATFNAYTSANTFDQAALAATARELVARGVFVMVSNSATPLVRELYADFAVDTVKCPRAINSKGSRRGAVDEIIAIGVAA